MTFRFSQSTCLSTNERSIRIYAWSLWHCPTVSTVDQNGSPAPHRPHTRFYRFINKCLFNYQQRILRNASRIVKCKTRFWKYRHWWVVAGDLREALNSQLPRACTERKHQDPDLNEPAPVDPSCPPCVHPWNGLESKCQTEGLGLGGGSRPPDPEMLCRLAPAVILCSSKKVVLKSYWWSGLRPSWIVRVWGGPQSVGTSSLIIQTPRANSNFVSIIRSSRPNKI